MAFLRKYWFLPAFLAAAVLCAWLAGRIVGSLDYHHTDNDFFTFWQAGRLVTQGGSPYDTAAWTAGYQENDMVVIPNPAFLYPLPLALLLAPLGLLSFHTAYLVWVTLLQLMILAALILLLSATDGARAKLYFLPLLAGTILFRPTILTLFQGQVSGLFLLTLALGVWCWQKGKWAWGGLLLGLFVLKPNLAAPLLLLVGLWLLVRRRWTALLGMLTTGVVLLAAGIVYNPGWMRAYWQVGNNKLAETFGGSPTVWGLGALACHNAIGCTLAVGGIAGAVLILGFAWLVLLPSRRRHTDIRPAAVLGLAVAVTLLVTPYTWTYDQLLLLLPIVLLTIDLDRIGLKFPLAASLFIILDILVILLLIFDSLLQVEILNAFIPLLVFGGIFWLETAHRKTPRTIGT